MKQEWKDMDFRDDSKSARKMVGLHAGEVMKWIIGIMAVCMVLYLISFGLGFLTDTGNVVKKEFSASAMLKKYEWFKNASAALDEKTASAALLRGRTHSLDAAYEGVHRKDWSRDDRQQYSLWMTERVGLVASYNKLAAEYNAQMAKFNWAFTNAGDLPAGAAYPLPREYKPYQTGGK